MKCDLNLSCCFSHMESFFQMRLQVDKMCVIDLIRLCKCKVLAPCYIFFLILRNSHMCQFILYRSTAFLHQKLDRFQHQSGLQPLLDGCKCTDGYFCGSCLEIALLPSGSMGSVSSFLFEAFMTPSRVFSYINRSRKGSEDQKSRAQLDAVLKPSMITLMGRFLDQNPSLCGAG